jgi:hypothetical protein
MSEKVKGSVTVSDVNEAVEKVAPELTEKQRAKLEAKKQKAWNTMITRKEAYEMVNKALQETEYKLQMLFVQNRTLLELLDKKGIATEQEIDDMSKSVIESIFGPPPTQEGEATDEN